MEGAGWMERLRRSLSGGVWPFRGRRRPASPGAYLARRQRRRVLGLSAAVALVGFLAAGGILLPARGRSPRPRFPPLHRRPAVHQPERRRLRGLLRRRHDRGDPGSPLPDSRAPGHRADHELRAAGNDPGPGGVACPARRHLRPRGKHPPLREPAAGGGPARGYPRRLPDLVPDLRPEGRRRTRGPGRDRTGRRPGSPVDPPAGGRKDLPARPVVPEAYNQYLLARRFLAPSSQEGFLRAEAASEKAIALSPRFAPAWANPGLRVRRPRRLRRVARGDRRQPGEGHRRGGEGRRARPRSCRGLRDPRPAARADHLGLGGGE